MASVTALRSVELGVTDLRRSAAFYRECWGLRPVAEGPGGAGKTVKSFIPWEITVDKKLISSLAVLLLLGCTQLKPLDYGSWIDAAGRLLLVGFFVVAGLCNLTREQIKSHIDYMGEAGTPFPAAAFWIGIVLQFTGCALIIAGWHPEVGVYCLIVFILAATAIFHRFWSMTDPMRRNLARLFLLNNVAILGGLLLLLDRLP